jgi:aryl-alcohol dehydrogenase-like predicted oxidoreductase
MAKALDIAVTPWAPLAGGALTGKYLNDEAGRVKENSERRGEKAHQIASVVVDVAQRIGASPAQVAMQWTRQRDQVVIPIIGARLPHQLEDSLKCVDLVIPDDELLKLNEISKLTLGFPHEFLETDGVKDVLFGGTFNQVDNHRKKDLR